MAGSGGGVSAWLCLLMQCFACFWLPSALHQFGTKCPFRSSAPN